MIQRSLDRSVTRVLEKASKAWQAGIDAIPSRRIRLRFLMLPGASFPGMQWIRSRYRLPDRIIRHTLRDNSVLFLDLNHPAQRGIYLETFETFERSLLTRLVAPGATAFDIGAHIGFHTIALARKVGPMGMVHAFEPLPANSEALKRNLAENGLSNVVVNEVAVGDQEGSATFYVPTYFKTSMVGSLLSTAHEGATDPITVKVISIDEYCESHGINRIDLVKIDVEGAEYLVFSGMIRTIERLTPFIVCEVSRERLASSGISQDSIHRLFSQLDYRGYLVGEGLLLEKDDRRSGNWLFVPPNRSIGLE
jgi:FkbM family methyltransferase